MTFWPPSDTRIPANGQLVVEGFREARAEVEGIAHHRPRLVSREDVVSLRVESTHRGEGSVVQAVLQPERPLTPGLQYELQLGPPGESASLPPFLAHVFRGSWSVGWQAWDLDMRAPRWREPPKVVGQQAEWFGCGPAVHVAVSVSVEEETALAVLAELRRVDGQGPTVRYRVPVREGRADIGREMCGGPFELEPKVHYHLTLHAVDAAGNSTAAPGGALLVEGPVGD